MGLKIRLRQQGRSNRQTYRIVVADIRTRRDGKYVEMLGWYNPYMKKGDVQVNQDRLKYWIDHGAQISENVASLVKRAAPLVMQEKQKQKEAKRLKMLQKKKKKRAEAPKAAPKKAAAPKKEAAKPKAEAAAKAEAPKKKAPAKKKPAAEKKEGE